MTNARRGQPAPNRRTPPPPRRAVTPPTGRAVQPTGARGRDGQRVDVYRLWKNLEYRVKLLQSDKLLPADPRLWESGQVVVRDWLIKGEVDNAKREADKVANRSKTPRSKAAGFIAWELVKDYFRAVGQTEDASKAAKRAEALLAEYEKERRKEEARDAKKRGW